MEMERIFSCPQYASMEPDEEVSPSTPQAETPKKQKTRAPPPDEKKNLKLVEPEELDSDKQDLLAEIMGKWKEERGKLKIYCKACEREMIKIATTKKLFYRCSEFPDCTVQADPWYIEKAVEKIVTSHRKHADVLILYQYDESKNTIYVSEIYSEGKIFK